MDEHTFESQDGEHPLTVMDRVAEGRRRLELERFDNLVQIAGVHQSKVYDYDGLNNTTAFLTHRCGMSTSEARREIFLARSLSHLPKAVKYFQEGRLTLTQVEALARVRNQHPEAFAESEDVLCRAVEGLSASDTYRATEYWSQAHTHPNHEDPPEPSRVYLSRLLGGRGRLDGDLSPESRVRLETALDTLIDQLVASTPKEDLPSRSELRAQALDEILRRHLDSPDTPRDHGNRPQVTVRIDWDTLIGEDRGGECELGDGTIITPDTARRLACDARVCRLLTGPRGEILDLGRSQRTVSPAQWRALQERDRHCQFPGCRRPPHWCDAHHLDWWWADLGRTDLKRLILLCRHHHGCVLEGKWWIDGTPGNWIFTRPDGTQLPTHHANAPP